jgi:outer membrane protein OmpA-like peptidoglycan-associated protein
VLYRFVYLFILLTIAACSKRPFLPTNVGREDGNPKTPIVISHLSAENRWMVKRVKSGHNVFQRVLCFRYVCRAQVGRNRPKKGLSQKQYSKVLEKNRERGFDEQTAPGKKPVNEPFKTDSSYVKPDTIVVTDKAIKLNKSAEPIKLDSLVTLSEFLFETNSYQLKQAHVAELDTLVSFLLEQPSSTVTISGHTDNTGNEDRNLALSNERAKSVASYLVKQGIKPGRLSHIGMGSSKPIADNTSSNGRSRNRRVEILIRYVD